MADGSSGVYAGIGFAEVSSSPLILDRYVSLVADPGAGAISTFSGVTRNNFQGKEVIRLEYEAYEPMALKKLNVSSSAPSQAPQLYFGPLLLLIAHSTKPFMPCRNCVSR